jgi:hypothetical protein
MFNYHIKYFVFEHGTVFINLHTLFRFFIYLHGIFRPIKMSSFMSSKYYLHNVLHMALGMAVVY